MVPEGNTSNRDAIQTTGAAVDLGVEHLKLTYGEIFNFSHTYLMDPGRPEVALLLDDVLNFAAKFAYQNSGTDGLAFLSSCTIEQNKILSFTQAHRILLGCSVGSVPVSPTVSNDHCFGLSIFPGSVAMKFIYALLTTNGWFNIAGLADLHTINGESLSRGYRTRFQERFNGLDPSLKYIRYSDIIYNSSQGYPAVEKALQTLRETSRVVFLFGSGKSFLMILRTAERLGMINGEYVFFMLTFSRFGVSLDNWDDTWWKVTDATADLPIPVRGYVSRATIVISFRNPYSDGLDKPIRDLRSRIIATARRNYNMTYPRSEVPTLVYAAYEMYQVYGMLLNQTYALTGRIMNGLELAKLLRRQTFHLPTGIASFSRSGERSVDMLGEILNPRTGNYVTSFLYDAASERLSNTSDIAAIWPGGAWPPPNEPLCGYMGNSCPSASKTEGNLKIAVGTSVGIGLMLIAIGIAVLVMR
ncbi:hypothetical protein BV898_11437 [Hypsibius exemplaris]|uniref:Receptor ligand binding region domain-containing protein n=1 Tax=Hypsibius exemplaris TaxID=2072580 RepID=A0A1W0WGK2_HYPEX|nr:hypothetical protein BV898_11437 [Hypsibius exemplaris]